MLDSFTFAQSFHVDFTKEKENSTETKEMTHLQNR